MTKLNLFVLENGDIRFVYDDALLPLIESADRHDVKRAGTVEIVRGGEPPPEGSADTRWVIEYGWRVNVGAESRLTRTREQALQVERKLVEANIAVI